MKTLLKISWRNVWRNRQRSITMILAITAGLWGGLFAASIAMGLMNQRFQTGIEQEISHVQIHNPDYITERNPQYYIANREEIYDLLDSDDVVRHYSGRSLVNGMIGSANLTRGITIMGVDPVREANTSGLENNVIEGEYFSISNQPNILIGQRLAEKLKARPGSRVVLTFQDIHNEIVSVAGRVSGIFRTANTMFDESHIYMTENELNHLLGKQNIVNQIAIILNDYELSQEFSDHYSERFPELTIRPWLEISPQMGFYYEMGMAMFMIILIIILLALAFGLLNTMLMSVFERIRELGILMSIGMNKKRIFSMILFETIFLTLSGAVCGMLAGHLTINLLKNNGINFASVGGDSLNQYGFETIVYPQLDYSMYFFLTILVIITAVATGIYPALKAIRLKPAEAARTE
ncbi:MAG: FtsX-like permease family protein [Bacteroidales bacterium]|nr:FtsX-like permease family protein [Bacteroidales bacterium]